jgi:hypothetical protein
MSVTASPHHPVYYSRTVHCLLLLLSSYYFPMCYHMTCIQMHPFESKAGTLRILIMFPHCQPKFPCCYNVTYSSKRHRKQNPIVWQNLSYKQWLLYEIWRLTPADITIMVLLNVTFCIVVYRFLRSVGVYLLDCTKSQPRRPLPQVIMFRTTSQRLVYDFPSQTGYMYDI